MAPWKKPLAVFLVSASLAMGEQWTGWLTDKKCGENPVAKYEGEVHKKHVQDGQPIVLVNESDKSIHTIANPDKVEPRVGQKVKVQGKIKADGTIEVDTVTPLSPAPTTGD